MPPPNTSLMDAQRHVALAETTEAEIYAPIEVRYAQEKLSIAQTAIANKDYKKAELQAKQAQVDAELALAKTRYAKARMAVQEKVQENKALREHLQGNG